MNESESFKPLERTIETGKTFEEGFNRFLNLDRAHRFQGDEREVAALLTLRKIDQF